MLTGGGISYPSKPLATDSKGVILKKGIIYAHVQDNAGNRSYKPINGYISKDFGYAKNDENTYDVIHLKSGWKFFAFDFVKQARAFIEAMEKEDWPVPWSQLDRTDKPDIVKPNIDRSIQLARQAELV